MNELLLGKLYFGETMLEIVKLIDSSHELISVKVELYNLLGKEIYDKTERKYLRFYDDIKIEGICILHFSNPYFQISFHPLISSSFKFKYPIFLNVFHIDGINIEDNKPIYYCESPLHNTISLISEYTRNDIIKMLKKKFYVTNKNDKIYIVSNNRNLRYELSQSKILYETLSIESFDLSQTIQSNKTLILTSNVSITEKNISFDSEVIVSDIAFKNENQTLSFDMIIYILSHLPNKYFFFSNNTFEKFKSECEKIGVNIVEQKL